MSATPGEADKVYKHYFQKANEAVRDRQDLAGGAQAGPGRFRRLWP